MENMKRGGGTAVSETEQVSEQSLQLRLSQYLLKVLTLVGANLENLRHKTITCPMMTPTLMIPFSAKLSGCFSESHQR